MAMAYRLERERQERQPVGRNQREGERDSLYRRLDAGYRKVEQGLAEGRDVTEWEAYWRELLREYERICDDLDRELAA